MKKLILLILVSVFTINSFAQTENSKKTADLKKFMQIEFDKYQDVTYVSHKPWVGNSDFRLNCTFEIKDEKPSNLRLNIVYYGKDWLYINKIIFLIDGKKYELPVDPKRIVEGGYAVEKASSLAAGITLEIINQLMINDKVEFRYVGKDYFKDNKNLSIDLKRLRKVVEYYRALGGN